MKQQPVTIAGMLGIALLLLNVVILETAMIKDERWYQALWLTVPLLIIALFAHFGKQQKRTGRVLQKQSS